MTDLSAPTLAIVIVACAAIISVAIAHYILPRPRVARKTAAEVRPKDPALLYRNRYDPAAYNKLLPMADRIVIKRDAADEKTAGGLHLPQTAQDRHKPQEGEVLAVGPGRVLESGSVWRIDERIAPGVRVLFTRYAGSEVAIDGEGVLIVAERDILCILQAKVDVNQREFKHESPDATPSLRQHLLDTRVDTRVDTPMPRKSFPVS